MKMRDAFASNHQLKWKKYIRFGRKNQQSEIEV